MGGGWGGENELTEFKMKGFGWGGDGIDRVLGFGWGGGGGRN